MMKISIKMKKIGILILYSLIIIVLSVVPVLASYSYSTVITITDTGSSIGSLTPEEFTFLQNDFYPKTLDIKDDYLFAANIKNNYFEITDDEFDARAFRANSADVIKVFNGNSEIPVEYPFNPATLVAQTAEQFNSFNDSKKRKHSK